VLFYSELPLDCKIIGGGWSVSSVRSLGASRAAVEFRSVRSFFVEDVRTSIPEFSLGSLVTDLKKREQKKEIPLLPIEEALSQ
jgi:hypothetical protein